MVVMTLTLEKMLSALKKCAQPAGPQICDERISQHTYQHIKMVIYYISCLSSTAFMTAQTQILAIIQTVPNGVSM
jgi:hypothetical protein